MSDYIPHCPKCSATHSYHARGIGCGLALVILFCGTTAFGFAALTLFEEGPNPFISMTIMFVSVVGTALLIIIAATSRRCDVCGTEDRPTTNAYKRGDGQRNAAR